MVIVRRNLFSNISCVFKISGQASVVDLGLLTTVNISRPVTSFCFNCGGHRDRRLSLTFLG